MTEMFEFVKHFGPEKLQVLFEAYGVWVYAILFLIVFAETGLVIAPFLPGDSLLFAAGFLCAAGNLNIWLLTALLVIAAIVGDTVNYHVGKWLGPKVLRGEKSWLFNRQHLEKTQHFFEKHGAKTIILARFMPIVRTYAPFVAGVGAMNYSRFLLYNAVGGIVWVVGFLWLGYFLGDNAWVKTNFQIAVLVIIALSALPIAWEMLNHFLHRAKEPAAAKAKESA